MPFTKRWLGAPTLAILVFACSSEPAGVDSTSSGGGSAGKGSTSAGLGGASGSSAANASSSTAMDASSSANAVGAGGASTSASAGTGGTGAASSSSAATSTTSSSSTASSSTSASSSASSSGSGVTFPPNCKCMNLGPPACTPMGHVTYTLAKAANPTAEQQSAYDAITCAMDGAVAYYNCYTSITKQLNVTYVPSVQTADGNYNGSIRFGPDHSYMECVTGMHEIAHTVGVGQAPNWNAFSVGGLFTGTAAVEQLRAITGNPSDVLHSDTQHFWPYGLNYTSEAKSTQDLIDHCMMVTAIRKDLGLK